MRKFCGLLLLASISACSQPPAESGPAIVVPDAAHVSLAETLVPADPTLAAIYDRSCRACHALDGLGAPLSGHTAAWTPRLEERGLEGVLASVHTGRGAMPSMGYCPDCTDEDFRALIEFMSTEGQP